MPDKISVKVTMPFKRDKPIRKLTTSEAIRLIEGKNYSPEMKVELIARLKLQPQNTYEAFLENINNHIKKIQDKNKAMTQLEHDKKNDKPTGEAGSKA